jgi:hypothetical protein
MEDAIGLMHRWKQTIRDGAGQEIAEAAIVLPLFFLFLGGILWFGGPLTFMPR